MKRVLRAVLAAVISVAFVTCVFAQAPSKKAPAADQKAPAAEKATKGKTMVSNGEVTAVNPQAKSITVKSAKGEDTFATSGVKKMGTIKTGDRVTVKYMEQDGKKVAKSVKMVGAKKGAKKTSKAPTGEEKK